MFCMCIDRGCIVTGESTLCSVCVLTEGALVQGRLMERNKDVLLDSCVLKQLF